MSATATKSWPTRTEVDALTEELQLAYSAVDEFSIRTHLLRDAENTPEEFPVPTDEEIAALTLLVVELDSKILGLKTWRDEFRELRDSASIVEQYRRQKDGRDAS